MGTIFCAGGDTSTFNLFDKIISYTIQSDAPSNDPTMNPSMEPTDNPTVNPSINPSMEPTANPTSVVVTTFSTMHDDQSAAMGTDTSLLMLTSFVLLFFY